MKAAKEAGRVGGRGGGAEGWRGTRRIIETGRVQLGREIEMLSPSRAYRHQRRRGEKEKNQLKSQNINMRSYAEKCGGEKVNEVSRGPEKRREGNVLFLKHRPKGERIQSSFIQRN